MNIYRRFLLIPVLAATFGVGATDAAPPPAGPPREAVLGEQALAARDYPAAWEYFRQLREQAAPESGLREHAYNGLFSAALALREADRLAALLAEYDRDFPGRNDQRRRFLGGELAFLQGDHATARQVFDELLKGGALPGELYFQLLGEQGRLHLAQEEYAEAAALYALLAKSAAGTPRAADARLKEAYATMKAGNLTASGELLAPDLLFAEATADAALVRELTLLRLMQMYYERKYSELDTAYRALPPPVVGEADPLRYELASLAAENHAKNNRVAEAVAYWTDAFRTAPEEAWRRLAAQRIINAYSAADQLQNAFDALRKYLELYPALPGDEAMRLLQPRLLARLGRNAEALTQYAALLADANFAAAEWRLAAQEAAGLYRTAGQPQQALEVLNRLEERSTTDAERQEAGFLLGEHYFASQDWATAAKRFQALAGAGGAYRMRAQYWALRSLVELKEWTAALDMADQLQKGADSTPGMRSAAFYYRGLVLERLGRLTEAIQAYNNGADKFPKSEYALASRFQAAELAWDERDYQAAAEWFALVAEQARQPGMRSAADTVFSATELDDLAANAWYRGCQAACFAERPAEMNALLDELKQNYPQSPYTAGALFWQIDYLKSVESFDMALAVLQEMADFYAENVPERLPAIWYDQAVLNGRLNRVVDALNVLERLNREFPQDALVADSWYLTGDLLTRDGKFEAAREAYTKALTARPEGQFALATQGRLGDCSYELFGQHRRGDDLKLAQLYYENILENPQLDPAMLAQTLYKLGRTLEAAKEPEAALTRYKELLYLAADSAADGRIPGEVWVVKGGYAAIKLCLSQNDPESARRVLQIVRLMESLDLPTGDDFRSLVRAVREKYRI